MLPENLADLTNDELQRLQKMLDIAKLNLDIEESRQRMEESRKRLEQDMAESRARTEKLTKELAWYPWLPIATTLLTGGLVVFLLGKVL
ncbi:hypothetical protein MOMA_09226 [Moraxella macacae 0408225]|uniref:Uncharacterized protein n=1 Tax=Moraxella macacae 0408225 TaxID=1230338 RepID=L2F6M8_9GAMM|nr:DNA-binding protein [Moraxella macacae]ELA08729.1 hypothetical protein MOMA_09226 [Moraxella macacae 0408225]